jgi:hypothetical protein
MGPAVKAMMFKADIACEQVAAERALDHKLCSSVVFLQ